VSSTYTKHLNVWFKNEKVCYIYFNVKINKSLLISNSGYMAPEYAMEGLFSVKSDVFSYGVLVLEIICGKKNSGFYLSECGQSLTLYVSFQCYPIKVLEQNLF